MVILSKSPYNVHNLCLIVIYTSGIIIPDLFRYWEIVYIQSIKKSMRQTSNEFEKKQTSTGRYHRCCFAKYSRICHHTTSGKRSRFTRKIKLYYV